MSETDAPTDWATSTLKDLLNSSGFSLVVKMQCVLVMVWYWRQFSNTDCRLFQNTFCVNNLYHLYKLAAHFVATAHKTDDLFVVSRVEGLESCWGSRSGWKGVQGDPLYQHARHDSTKWEYQIELWGATVTRHFVFELSLNVWIRLFLYRILTVSTLS